MRIPPTDVGQSVIRVSFVLTVLIWSIARSQPDLQAATVTLNEVSISVVYFIFSIVVYAHLRVIGRIPNWRFPSVFQTRIICLVTDAGALCAYTAVAEQNVLVLTPFYITYIIGNGFRFGMRYFSVAAVLSLSGLFVGARYNQYLQQESLVYAALCFAILSVPLYSLSLLIKYQSTLKDLKKATLDLEKFIEHMSHEYRAPLQTIINVARLQPDELPSDTLGQSGSARYRERMNIIQTCCERLLRVTNQIISDSIKSNNHATTQPENETLTIREVYNAVNICRPRAFGKGLKFHWHIQEDTPDTLRADPDLFSEILINLLDNAIKYTREGSVNLVVEPDPVDIDELRIRIFDTGSGFGNTTSHDNFGSVGAPFGLGQYSSGIGLPTVRYNLDKIGGRLSYEHNYPSGTICSVNIPLVQATPNWDHDLSWHTAFFIATSAPEDGLIQHLASIGFLVIWLPPSDLDSLGIALTAVDVLFADDDSIASLISDSLTRSLALRRPIIVGVGSESSDKYWCQDHINFRINQDRRVSFLGPNSKHEHLSAGQKLDSNSLLGMSALIVDDSGVSVEAMGLALQEYGLDVEGAMSIPAARALVTRRRFDYLLCDYYIGEEQALDFIAWVATKRSDETIVLMFSGDNSRATKDLALANGAYGFFVKPTPASVIAEQLVSIRANTNNSSRPSFSSTGEPSLKYTHGSVADSFDDKIALISMLKRFRKELLTNLTKMFIELDSRDDKRKAKARHKVTSLCQVMGAWRLEAAISQFELTKLRDGSSLVSLASEIEHCFMLHIEQYLSDFDSQQR